MQLHFSQGISRLTFDLDTECTKVTVQFIKENDKKTPGRSKIFKIIDPQNSHRELIKNYNSLQSSYPEYIMQSGHYRTDINKIDANM